MFFCPYIGLSVTLFAMSCPAPAQHNICAWRLQSTACINGCLFPILLTAHTLASMSLICIVSMSFLVSQGFSAIGKISPTETCCWVVILTQIFFLLSTSCLFNITSLEQLKWMWHQKWTFIPRNLNSMQMPSGHSDSYLCNRAKQRLLQLKPLPVSLLLWWWEQCSDGNPLSGHIIFRLLWKMQFYACANVLPHHQHYLCSAHLSYNSVGAHVTTNFLPFPHTSNLVISRPGPPNLMERQQ